MEKKPKINLKEIRKTLAYMKEEPRRIAMAILALKVDGDAPMKCDLWSDDINPEVLGMGKPPCGTVGCFVGNNAIINDPELAKTKQGLSDLMDGAYSAARDRMGFTSSEAKDVFEGEAYRQSARRLSEGLPNDPKAEYRQLVKDINAVLKARGLKSRVR